MRVLRGAVRVPSSPCRLSHFTGGGTLVRWVGTIGWRGLMRHLGPSWRRPVVGVVEGWAGPCQRVTETEAVGGEERRDAVRRVGDKVRRVGKKVSRFGHEVVHRTWHSRTSSTPHAVRF